jgi:hypothetical protein
MRAFVHPDARRSLCPHHATRLTSPTKSGLSPRTFALLSREAWPPAEVATEARGKRSVLPAEERMFVADAALRVPYTMQTLYYHFRRWRRIDERLRRAHDRLRTAAVREAEGRERDPSAAVVDSQVVKTTPVGGPERGYDGAKRLAGRKRHLLVDTSGLVLAARVHSADLLPDRETETVQEGGCWAGGTRAAKDGVLVWADGAYTRAGSASGCAASWGGAWRCRITTTGSSMALRAGG